ncbi:hypothetical protein [Algoriphagus sp.]|uniref:hypothetical protein n=1 Tax=Algoriphagus sp. TaxID=1872435 RepID=UPI003F715013
MIKELFKDSFLHVQYWYFRELKRAISLGLPLRSILNYYPKYVEYNLDYGKSPLKLGIPWITLEATSYLSNLIHPNMKVFEFGSGGSTKFFVERVEEIHSVEHDEKWYDWVKKELGNTLNLNLRLVKGCEVIEGRGIVLDEDNDPLDYRDYANAILDYEDGYFDLILIDGKARNACIENSLKKLKLGGILVVDNSHRKSYKDSLDRLEAWLELRSFGPTLMSKRFTETTFFKKPSNHV